MLLLSVASRTALEAERQGEERKKASFWLRIGLLEKDLPQSAPQIDFSCYTVGVGVIMEGSPIVGL
jgi:hypothetical protein